MELHASRAACCSAKLTAFNVSLRRTDACEIRALQRGGCGAALGRAVLANTALHALHAGEVKAAKLHALRAAAREAKHAVIGAALGLTERCIVDARGNTTHARQIHPAEVR